MRAAIALAAVLTLSGCATLDAIVPPGPVPPLPPGPADWCGGETLITYHVTGDGSVAAGWCHNHDTGGIRR